MNWLIVYAVMGVAILMVLLISRRVPEKNDSSGDDLWEPLRGPKSLNQKVLEWTLFVVFVLVAWPILILAILPEIKSLPAKACGTVLRESKDEEDRSKPFALTCDDLHQQLTLEAIEQAEFVVDPLYACPDAPFGHLNGAWVTFKAQLEPDDEVWAYCAKRRHPWIEQAREVREGYACVRNGEIGRWFIASHWLATEDEIEFAHLLASPQFATEESA